MDHTHADALLAITNTPDGERRVREIYGKDTVIVPYVMPGFDLARHCARQFAAEAGPGTIGMVLMNHGIFSFGATARESYERMIALVARAEDYLARHGAWELPRPAADGVPPALRTELARLRQEISACAGFPVVLAAHSDPKYLAFARRADVARDLAAGAGDAGSRDPHQARADARPRRRGLCRGLPRVLRPARAVREGAEDHARPGAAGHPRSRVRPGLRRAHARSDARIVRDIYDHTIDVILRATALGGYRALPERDIFDVEYWDLEQAKLQQGGRAAGLRGRSRARDRRRLGHRQGLRGSLARSAARPWSASTSIPSDRGSCTAAPTSSG